MNNNYDLITILGPTACGKTTLACELAYELDTEIISADSRQVYRNMDIGTGKDLSDYIVNGKTIPYHLIDICDAGEKYNVFEFQHNFYTAYNSIKEKTKLPILCGGTGMYIESVLKGFRLLAVPENPELRKSLEGKTLEELTEMLRTYKNLHNNTDVDSAKRAIRAIEIEEYQQHQKPEVNEFSPLDSLIIGIDIEREERRRKISKRLKARLEEGMIDEVQQILNKGVSPEGLIYYGLEYKYVTLYLTGQLTYSEMYAQLEVAIHQFAKRQMTWFRGMERRGFTIHWIPSNIPNKEKIEIIKSKLSN
ncbi:tRNA (adenosine(37)-N6)-dimethylallyltransferase MiaA [Paludibacter sp. 221]|uniref:tRNA (adenosine(37)-N6)-dimethylallyltransferase MiaA n=1 Tax=Paludibacter sp. 221 TaxID=2302939 RepID=UPI0013D80607|nr:tRNA (adenosine(37)-N6)-dimethylallyltransferase MiaA [Paludibacter sp. 221]NDV46894.1 tRNA (adenosine(37)-N6)-dimethylallyltransferase MiaA [Paludibacter sp. 221]